MLKTELHVQMTESEQWNLTIINYSKVPGGNIFTPLQWFTTFTSLNFVTEILVCFPKPATCVGLQTSTANQTNATSAAIEFWEWVLSFLLNQDF